MMVAMTPVNDEPATLDDDTYVARPFVHLQ